MVFSDSRKTLREIRAAIVEAMDAVRLEIHPGKSRIYRCCDGVTFLGWRLFPHRTRLVAGNVSIEETTDGSGKIDKDIPPEATLGTLTLWMDESNPSAQVFSFRVELGALEPETTVSGAQQRLQNLGYNCGPVTGAVNEQTQEAIRAFQRGNSGLTVNGNLDDATKSRLKSNYKS